MGTRFADAASRVEDPVEARYNNYYTRPSQLCMSPVEGTARWGAFLAFHCQLSPSWPTRANVGGHVGRLAEVDCRQSPAKARRRSPGQGSGAAGLDGGVGISHAHVGFVILGSIGTSGTADGLATKRARQMVVFRSYWFGPKKGETMADASAVLHRFIHALMRLKYASRQVTSVQHKYEHTPGSEMDETANEEHCRAVEELDEAWEAATTQLPDMRQVIMPPAGQTDHQYLSHILQVLDDVHNGVGNDAGWEVACNGVRYFTGDDSVNGVPNSQEQIQSIIDALTLQLRLMGSTEDQAAESETKVDSSLSPASTEPEQREENRVKDLAVPDTNGTDRDAKTKELELAIKNAYFSFKHAEAQNDRRLEDREAYDWLKENGIDTDKGDIEELADYRLPAFDTWIKQLRKARGQDRPIVSLDPPQITIGDAPYALNETAATLLKKLVDSGDWVNGGSIVNQPSRVVARMPKEVRRIVESSPGKGFRINLNKE